jgi:trehalose 6-phosphate phosphatase
MSDPHRPPPPPFQLDGIALFLDFDGTLVDLADSPEAIRVPPTLHSLLGRLSRALAGRVAVISGRSLADLDRHLGGSALAMSGSHGLELRFAGGSQVPVAPPPGLEAARQALLRFAAADPGLLVEEKPASVALHYRLAPARAEEARAFLHDLAGRTGLSVQPGKMVMELRPDGADKGDALRKMMTEPPFAGARPWFVGDDLTDEDAFVAAAELGGAGVLVGPARDTAARWRLDDVAAVAAWLDGIARG